jgi:hypothetical protein
MPKRSLSLLVLLAILIPIAVYLRVWDYYAVNIAKWDDHVLKQTILDYVNASGIGDILQVLGVQHNEHRIFLTRLLTLVDYSWFGQLNYKHLMLGGNLLFLLVIVLWWRLLKHNGKPLFSLVPVALIWPTLAHWENMYWGMASIQNFGVVTLVVVSLYWCLKGPGSYFVGGIILGSVAAFSSGNGLIALPIACALVLVTRQYRRGMIVAIAAGITLTLYFLSYSKPDYNPEARAGFWALLKGFMAFLGSFAEALPVKGRQDTTVIFGVILFLVSVSIGSATLLRLLKNQYTNQVNRMTDAFCLGVLVFVLATAAIVVWGRAGFGIETLITSRYKIYSFLLLLTAYLFIVIPIRGSFFNPYVSGVALLCFFYNVLAYHYYLVDAYNLRKFMVTSYFNQVYNNKELDPFVANTEQSAGLVARPSLFYERWLPLLPRTSSEKVLGNLPSLQQISESTQVVADENSVEVVNTSYRSQRLQDSGVYLLLSGSDRYYLLPTFRERNQNKKQLFFRSQYFAPGFRSDHTFDELEINPGKYGYAFILQKGDSTGVLMAKDSLLVRPYRQSERIKTNW